jgi:hypothetical protein
LREIRIYCPTPHVGHGLDARSLEIAIGWKPDFVVAQGTSTDPGPFYLGKGISYMQGIQVKKDLSALIVACREACIPFIVSSGGAGDNASLSSVLEIVDEIAPEERLDLNLAIIQGEVSKDWINSKLRCGAKARRIVNSRYLQEYLDEGLVNQSIRIVAQMGPEPVMKVFEKSGIHGVITGRALDVGLFVAMPLLKGFPTALSMHFATVMHDGALAALPGSGSDGIFGVLNQEFFLLEPPNPKRRCIPTSVAAMAFYERPNPFEEIMPSGILDVSHASYEAVTDRAVRVFGARWKPTQYTLKLEGAILQGYRAISIGGACDPRFIMALDDILTRVRGEVGDKFREQSAEAWQLQFRVYGRDAVLVQCADSSKVPAEVGIMIDVLATSQDLANAICSVTRSALFHQGYPGRKTTAGNLAVPFSPVEIPVGPSYRYNIWHALEINDPLEPFPLRYEYFPRG